MAEQALAPKRDRPYQIGVPISLDEFAGRCGYFCPTFYFNNGYGCLHRGNVERERDAATGYLQGKCFDFSCPLAASISPNEPLDVELMVQHDFAPGSWSDGTWVLPHTLPPWWKHHRPVPASRRPHLPGEPS